ncbi:MAG: hypothetical protein WCJ26_15150 [bacterium]
MGKHRNNRIQQYFFYTLFCLSLALTWFFHKDSVKFNDPNELWSDRAGYYIYLPATFFYHFDARKMPADLDVQTGGGFSIDTLHNKIDTKYTYGVALLASPFFVAAGIVSRVAGYHSEYGFSMIYMRMMALAAVVYLLLGLWFLKKFLDCYFQPLISYFVITLIFLGTNLFYYSLIDGMMSHVYSFFLFSLILYILKIYRESKSMRLFILLSIIFSLVVLIRPTNIILGLLFFALDAAGFTEMQCRLKKLLEPAHILSFAAILSIVFLPQLVYWKYLSGNWLHFSYRDEGFTNLLHPEAAGVLFSPLNGLLAYTPMALIMLLGTAGMIFRKKTNGWPIAVVFILVTLICASWKMWYFGCSFGQRSYIEYYAILAVPMGYFITWIFNMRRLIASTILLFVVFLFVCFNLRYTISFYRFERCYYGSTWDWDHYLRSVQRAGIISPVGQIKSFENDFENLALSPVVRPSKIFTCSGLYSISSDKNAGTTLLYSARLDEFGYPYPKMIEVEAWFLKPGNRITDASLSYTLNRGREILFSDDQPLDSLVQKPLTWSKVGKTFIIPDVNDSSLQINVFIKNPKHVLLFADDLKIKFRYHW